MAVVHERLEELEEIGDEQIADVQSVHVGVGGENHLVVTQVLDVVLDVERAHEICASSPSPPTPRSPEWW